MGHKLSPEHKALYRRVDEVLHYVWDPIGVADTPEARDEYDSYAPRVFALLIAAAPAEEISRYLVGVEIERMGLSPSTGAVQRAGEVVQLLERWRDWIRERTPTI